MTINWVLVLALASAAVIYIIVKFVIWYGPRGVEKNAKRALRKARMDQSSAVVNRTEQKRLASQFELRYYRRALNRSSFLIYFSLVTFHAGKC